MLEQNLMSETTSIAIEEWTPETLRSIAEMWETLPTNGLMPLAGITLNELMFTLSLKILTASGNNQESSLRLSDSDRKLKRSRELARLRQQKHRAKVKNETDRSLLVSC